MKDFINEHFNVIFLGMLAIAAWMGTLHLMHAPNMAPENISWAREQAGGIIYALLALMTGYKAGQLSKLEKPPEPKKDPVAPDEVAK